MKSIAEMLGVEVRIGDYPYAAWYSVEGWETDEWKGYWFALETDSAIIFVPEKYNHNQKAFGFLHEVGHIMDWKMGITHDNVWDGEVSAWEWSRILLKRYYPDYDYLAFKQEVFECLGTYAHRLDDEAQWFTTMKKLGFF